MGRTHSRLAFYDPKNMFAEKLLLRSNVYYKNICQEENNQTGSRAPISK